MHWGCNKTTPFAEDLDKAIRKVAPALSPNRLSSLRQTMTRSDIAGLRQALNGCPLRHEFGPALVEVLLRADLRQDSGAVTDYLNQSKEVEWAEEALFRVLEALANTATEDTTFYQEQIVLNFATLRNRAKFYHVYALRLLDALHVEADTLQSLDQLTAPQPHK